MSLTGRRALGGAGTAMLAAALAIAAPAQGARYDPVTPQQVEGAI